MKNPASDFESEWEKRLQQARTDSVPAIDGAALLRAVRNEPLRSPDQGWAAAFSQRFAERRAFTACLASAGVFAILAVWPMWECWQELAWIQMLAPPLGGVS
jgi:hypothetical protein